MPNRCLDKSCVAVPHCPKDAHDVSRQSKEQTILPLNGFQSASSTEYKYTFNFSRLAIFESYSGAEISAIRRAIRRNWQYMSERDPQTDVFTCASLSLIMEKS